MFIDGSASNIGANRGHRIKSQDYEFSDIIKSLDIPADQFEYLKDSFCYYSFTKKAASCSSEQRNGVSLKLSA